MEVTILGSGTCVPRLKRSSPGLAVQVGKEQLLLDGGAGTLRRMLEAGIDYKQLDYIFYTHLHPDHTAELIPILFAIKNTPGWVRERPLKIFGPSGFGKFFKQLSQIYGDWIISPSYKLTVQELKEDLQDFGSWLIKTRPVRHSYDLTCIGYRIEEKGTGVLVYSGDTDYCPEIISLAEAADMAVLECSYPDSHKIPGHLTPSLAGRIAQQAQCKKLVLTHLYPACDEVDMVAECKKVFEGDIVVAEDLMRLVI
ncbi:MAG: MBL fold metallo-hydrolase [candidate division KSB1 bacterium]|nr:MBL fold metallo-hydrolase [candidate division KSB1 bacterium]